MPERVVLAPVDLDPSNECVRVVMMAFVKGTEPAVACGVRRQAIPSASPVPGEGPAPVVPAPAPLVPGPAAPALPPRPQAANPAPLLALPRDVEGRPSPSRAAPVWPAIQGP